MLKGADETEGEDISEAGSVELSFVLDAVDGSKCVGSRRVSTRGKHIPTLFRKVAGELLGQMTAWSP